MNFLFIKSLIPGLIAIILIGIIGILINLSYGVPVMLIALLLGMSSGFLHRKTSCKAGIEFSASKLLRFGVALIGLRIAFSDILLLGWQTGIVIIAAVISTIVFGIVLARVFGLPQQFGILSGGATGICGASAALAISSVLPKNKDTEANTLLTIIGVTLLSTITMISYPMLSQALGLGDMETSIFLGGSIHDVAQVVGAGYSLSPEIGDLAVLTKLMRVALLVPVILVLITFFAINTKQQKTATIFPVFLSVFIILMVINSIMNLPPIITETATIISKYTLMFAIVAIGMKTNLKQLIDTGYKPMLIILLETLWIAGIFLIYFTI